MPRGNKKTHWKLTFPFDTNVYAACSITDPRDHDLILSEDIEQVTCLRCIARWKRRH